MNKKKESDEVTSDLKKGKYKMKHPRAADKIRRKRDRKKVFRIQLTDFIIFFSVYYFLLKQKYPHF